VYALPVASDEQRPLSTRTKLLIWVLALLLLACLAAVTFIELDRRAKRRRTLATLNSLLLECRRIAADWAERGWLEAPERKPLVFVIRENGFDYGGTKLTLQLPPVASGFVADAWGRAILVRIPGVQHSYGFDLYGTGPNGIDERGDGDDIILGEDIVPPR